MSGAADAGGQQSLHAARSPAPEHGALLRERAAALARVPVRESDPTEFLALRFRLGGEEYAVDVSSIVQVGVLQELAPLPGAAAPLFGITHWRGRVLAVLDLREHLGVRTTGLTDLSRLVIVDGGSDLFAFLADAVLEMAPVSARSLRPIADGRGAGRSLLRGMTEDGTLVIDADVLRAVFDAADATPQTQGRGG